MALIANTNPDQNPEDIIMIDDGTGAGIAIPTVIITKDFGNALKQAVADCEESNKSPMNRKQFVVLLVDFEMDNPDDRVEYDLWYTSGDVTALKFIVGMKAYNEKLGKDALLTPHIIVRNCPYCVDTDSDCRRYGNTMYCAGFYSELPITGRDSLSLGVDELCVYDIYKDEDNAAKWWSFMLEVYGCKDKRFSQYCIDIAQKIIGIDKVKLMDCKNKEAELLQREANTWANSMIPYSPAVVINNRVFRVTLRARVGGAGAGKRLQGDMCGVQCNAVGVPGGGVQKRPGRNRLLHRCPDPRAGRGDQRRYCMSLQKMHQERDKGCHTDTD
eukprot:TRINITY_DN6426_c0_g1_i7.p1 TRINITY_DN6426_c0_g1~~TRINITY_DN6426_c0_g1_i7.p1  ORF type:complete len:329 (+),score=53.20 TRINITY_DN6426_c0_g1_i7:539-1525(+)